MFVFAHQRLLLCLLVRPPYGDLIGHLLHINLVTILYVNPIIINVSFTAFDVKTCVLDHQQGHNAYMPDIYFYIEIKDDRK